MASAQSDWWSEQAASSARRLASTPGGLLSPVGRELRDIAKSQLSTGRNLGVVMGSGPARKPTSIQSPLIEIVGTDD